MSNVFIKLHITEHTGRGIPRITETYGNDVIRFNENSIVVTLPFERLGQEVYGKQDGSVIPLVGAEIPLVGDEIPPVRAEIPLVGDEIPPVRTEIPKVRAEIPKVRTEIPKVSVPVEDTI